MDLYICWFIYGCVASHVRINW